MRTQDQFVVAIFVALAVLVIFIYPLTFGPPAPQQKHSAIASLLACALAAVIACAATSLFAVHAVVTPFAVASPPSERLALICTRLC